MSYYSRTLGCVSLWATCPSGRVLYLFICIWFSCCFLRRHALIAAVSGFHGGEPEQGAMSFWKSLSSLAYASTCLRKALSCVWLECRNRDCEYWFYTPPPPGSNFRDCKCARIEPTASVHHPLWVVHRISLPKIATSLPGPAWARCPTAASWGRPSGPGLAHARSYLSLSLSMYNIYIYI